MKKRVLGLSINPGEIGWAVVEKYVSDFPEFPKTSTPYEIKDDTYIVDSTGDDVLVFKIFSFDSLEKRENFKKEIFKNYPALVGADSKPETGVYYLIMSDVNFNLKTKANEYMKRAIHSMDWFLERIFI